MTKCKKCGAPIFWVISPAGKWIPCDEGLIPYKQKEDGKDYVVSDDGLVIRCDLKFEGLPTGLARTAHWATCPYADSFRRKKHGDEK